MRKTLTTLSVALLIGATPVAAESFLNKALKKVEQGLDALDGKKQSTQTTNQQPAPAQNAPQQQEQLSRHDDPSGTSSQFLYNDKGDMSWMRSVDKYSPEDESIIFYAYTYDEQGNWIKRLTKDKKGAVTATTNRVITYY